MPKPDGINENNPFDGMDINTLKKTLEEMKENGGLPAGMPEDIEGLFNQAKDILKNVKKDPQSPAVGGNTGYVPFGLPASRKAVLLSAFFAEDLDRCEPFARMLESRGYQVEPNHLLSLSALKKLPGQDIGFLYIGSHATSEGYFGLGTEKTSEETELREEYDNTESVKRKTYKRVGKKGNLNDVEGYSARMGFFIENWLVGKKDPKKIFAQNSLVIICACDVQDENFINLLHRCGAGTVLAWKEDVALNVGVLTANYILDRLLGANMPDPDFYPEKLRQRPLEWGLVLQDMKNHHSPAGVPLGGPYYSYQTDKKASFIAHIGPGCAGPLLAPSLMCLRVDEPQKRLFVEGRFGPDLGEAKRAVFISENPGMAGSKKLQVKAWTEGVITCDLDPDTAGYVTVNVDGRTSNCIPLSVWKGQIIATATGDGSLKETCVMNFSLRTDAHIYRTAFTVPLNGKSSLPEIPRSNGAVYVGHELPSEVLAAYEASYLFIKVPITARASSASTLQYEAGGSVNYSPPRGNLVSLSLKGKGVIPSFTSDPKGLLKVAIDCFDLTLTIERKLKESNKAVEPFDEAYDILLELDTPWGNSKYQVARTAISQDGQSKTENIPVYSLGSVLSGKLLDLKNQKSFDLPDPNDNKPLDSGSDFKKITFNITAKVGFAPELSKGEDYFV